MLDALQGTIRRLLRVPPKPEPPLGDPRSVRVFRAARGYFRYRLAGWGLKQAGAVVGILFALAFLHFVPDEIPEWVPGPLQRAFAWVGWFGVIEAAAITFFLLQLPVSYLLLVLDYRYRWYVTTDRSLRIREGIWRVQERTMTFSNVQNLTVRQGPIQRLFGIADLQVQTAGGGGQQTGEQREGLADNLHIGYFHGVDNAAEIRDSILGHLRRLRAGPDSGLGDPDGPAAEPVETPLGAEPAGAAELLTAAREVLRETRALSASLRPAV